MPPSSPEFNTIKNENQDVPELKPYLDIERGDVHTLPTNSNHDDTNSPQHRASSHAHQNSVSQTNQADSKPLDPVALVKNLISTGFTPTPAQIAGANTNLSGSSDSSNTWFAIFLQRLIKQNKKRK